MPSQEILELWHKALSAAGEELAAGRRQGLASIERLATAVMAGTRSEPDARGLYDAAHALHDAPEDQVADRLRELVTLLADFTTSFVDQPPILVVDDDAITRRILDRALAASGRRVVHAATAAEARRLLQIESFALIVLDLVLPDADGRTVLMRIRESPETADVPVFILSGQVGALPKTECFALGADGYFEKPFDVGVLTTELCAALQQEGQRRRTAAKDPLTALPNRAVFREMFLKLQSQAKRLDQPLSLALIDMDGLKTINDTQGHEMGDRAIVHLVDTLRQRLRSSDVLARWGGDEFAVLLPDSDVDDVAAVIDDCRRTVNENPPKELTSPMSFSAGVVCVTPGMALETAIDEADQLLYKAKSEGRNKVATPAPARPSPVAQKILLAEDDAVSAAIVRHRLVGTGLEVLVVNDGQAAWEAIEQDGICLAVLDIQMPGIDGLELLRRIRTRPGVSDIPVIMLTALGSEKDVSAAFDAGATDYVTKPFSPIELVKRVQRLLK